MFHQTPHRYTKLLPNTNLPSETIDITTFHQTTQTIQTFTRHHHRYNILPDTTDKPPFQEAHRQTNLLPYTTQIQHHTNRHYSDTPFFNHTPTEINQHPTTQHRYTNIPLENTYFNLQPIPHIHTNQPSIRYHRNTSIPPDGTKINQDTIRHHTDSLSSTRQQRYTNLAPDTAETPVFCQALQIHQCLADTHRYANLLLDRN